ncbi:hypothetical protein HDU83_006178 [Entophlyctis luteolus]|nr:hypothetical protein HDU82_003088 [Entophlyctis luteolus]KAJ3342250.1 hypothetical protein HDU83_006178 [Entophlyctis luteolus]KAJ3391850.1 hypothetical protein HDU84_005201 [Entophlyctis sp. JEL0112]
MPVHRLTGKFGNKNFYKGRGSGPMGHWSQKGRYILDPQKFTQFMIPDLSQCKLTPYINPSIAKSKVYFSHSVRDYFAKENLPADLPEPLVQNWQRAANRAMKDLRAGSDQ